MVGLLILTLLWAASELLFPVAAPAPGEPALAFWNFAIPAALSVGSALINRGKDKGDSRDDSRMTNQARRDEERGTEAEQAYYDRLSSFDATEGAKRQADVLGRDWMQKFTEGAERLRGGQVSRHRLDTGYGMEDEDRYVRDATRQQQDALARLAMQAQGMDVDVARDLGRYGERTTGRALDIRQTEEDRKRADRAGKRQLWGNIGGALIQAGGTYLGSRGK